MPLGALDGIEEGSPFGVRSAARHLGACELLAMMASADRTARNPRLKSPSMSRSHRSALAFLAVVWVAACGGSAALAPDGSAPSSMDATVGAAAAEAGEPLFDGSVAEADIAEAMDESGDAGDAEACVFLDAYVPSAPVAPWCGARTPLYSCAPAHSCALSPELVA